MTKKKKIVINILSLLTAFTIFAAGAGGNYSAASAGVSAGSGSVIPDLVRVNDDKISTDVNKYFDNSAVHKLSDSISPASDISVIVEMNCPTILDEFNNRGANGELKDFASSVAGKFAAARIAYERKSYLRKLNASGVRYVPGNEYDTLLSGFEITIKAKDFDKLSTIFPSANLIVGETYEECITEVVTNDVDVYETGIFDSSDIDYQGEGVVVAVLDTGLDYTHTAFLEKNFETDASTDRFTVPYINNCIKSTEAYKTTPGLTADGVYVSRKVPYAYDYADKDPDVQPINSEHGTHVAGIIAGKDDTITGVAPQAQLAIMKVFSDGQTGAKTSWILAALEDCVTLDVDVINMSLGSSCGFAREVDEERINVIYDKIKDRGISLIAAASNDYNATMGSKKNGNNGLTSNPDSGTVGSPSTYGAALSVASVDGVKTPYIKYGSEIIYFNEASVSAKEKNHFIDAILGEEETKDFEYVTIAGVGKKTDYPEEKDYYQGKIVLVKRGTTTFEEKVRVALKEMGAAGIIIYNNVSGSISMSVGKSDKQVPVCSIAQDEGEMLAAAGTGKIRISRKQTAGPFMSDFSSWGPTSDLKIKPEITAHGGEILSAVPGQGYERLSGTSMAAPNQAGAAALIRQYVKENAEKFGATTPVEVTARVNQLMMSTADIVYNKNGLPFSVRKQGAGLINMKKSVTTAAYLTTYENGKEMDKSKLELGDDKSKTGEYEMTFTINNVTGSAVSYDISAITLTEGVSKTYTGHGEKTVTQEGYILGAELTVSDAKNGTLNGKNVTVGAKSSCKVTVKITLTGEDKAYLNESFEHGMYVEGFLNLAAKSGTSVNTGLPFLAFYGDWTEAPIFDEEYYDTNKDEINKGLDDNDKLMEDAYATRVIGGFYSDYIANLGSYYFIQNPAATQISANKNRIAISNQESGGSSTVTSIRSISAGLLRNAKRIEFTITDDSTGETVYRKTTYNQRKSHSAGTTIYASSIDIDYKTIEHNLKNNSKYTAKVEAFIDYGSEDEQNNARNVFTFPFTVDFQAPVITDVTYRSEYDKNTRKTKLFADISVYDNHYAMGMSLGQIVKADPASDYTFAMESFGKYVTPVYSEENTTTKVVVELTDYVAQIRNSAGIKFNAAGEAVIDENNDSFIVTCYDYAMNSATYQIRLPDEFYSLGFERVNSKGEKTGEIITEDNPLVLSPYETVDLTRMISAYPSESWAQTLDYEIVSGGGYLSIVNQTIIAKPNETGEIQNAVVKVTGKNGKTTVSAELPVRILYKGHPDYVKKTEPGVNKFMLTGYETLRAFHGNSSDEREIGVTGGSYEFGDNNEVSMYPAEKIRINYVLDSYSSDSKVTFVSGKKNVIVSEDGVITAVSEGSATVTLSVYVNGKKTIYTDKIRVKVKDSFATSAIYLTSYKGDGETVDGKPNVVVVPDNRGITTINSYAFCGYEFVEKDLDAGDVIDKEDPYYIKQTYLKNDRTIKKVIIPEGVTAIESYAFAGLESLEEVVLPSTLTKIGVGAFEGCINLSKINLNYAKFINEKAFYDCSLSSVKLDNVVSIGNYTFGNGSRMVDGKEIYNKFASLTLPASSQSLGTGAFAGCKELRFIKFVAPKIKIGQSAFENCSVLEGADVNAAVISQRAFAGCTQLKNVTLGKDVASIGEYAFAKTNVSKFSVNAKNPYFSAENDGKVLIKRNDDGTATLILVAPAAEGKIVTDAEYIGKGAFSGNTKINQVQLNNAAEISDYAFADCTGLVALSCGKVTRIGNYAFYNSKITEVPDLTNVTEIGDYAFALSGVTNVVIPEGRKIGDYAFYGCNALESVTLGNNVSVGTYAFGNEVDVKQTYEYIFAKLKDSEKTNRKLNEIFNGNYETYTINGETRYRYNFAKFSSSALKRVATGENVTLGDYAFADNPKLNSLVIGGGATIGKYAFFNAHALSSVDLSMVKSVGAYAFSGSRTKEYSLKDRTLSDAYELDENGNPVSGGGSLVKGFAYTNYSPVLENVNLSAAEYIGEGAFAYENNLKTVVLGEKVSEIPAYAFAFNKSLSSVTASGISSIGAYAFYGSDISSFDVSAVDNIGEYSFAFTKITKVVLKDGAELGEGAFVDSSVDTVENLNKAVYLGAYSLAGTAIEKADISSAVYIGDFAFASSKVTSVAFGNAVEYIGENPFAACEIKTYGKKEKITVSGYETEVFVNDYELGGTARVAGGVIYRDTVNGTELVSYPAASDAVSYEIAEGAVRICARAFENANLRNVSLPVSMNSVGHKAFYGCKKLNMVEFKSYYAPVLEEEFDESYITSANTPSSANGGLDITDFYMWNASSRYCNYFYGATFVDYIGKTNGEIVMVKPFNGKNYDTFILSEYFSRSVNGAVAPTDDTLVVINLINELPSSINLSCEDKVVAARKAYDAITTLDQKALITNYSKLTSAENTIQYIKNRDNPENPDNPDNPDKPDPATPANNKTGVAIGVTAAATAAVCALAFAAYIIITKKKKNGTV